MRRVLILLFSVVTLLAGCTHKELCEDHGHIVEIDVVFDWTNAADASPESMSLYLFSEDGTNPQRYELMGRDGGRIKISKGIYHAICFNGDTHNIECINRDNLSTFLIRSKDADDVTVSTGWGFSSVGLSTAMTSKDERLTREPDMLWVGDINDIVIDESCQPIVLTPEPSVMQIKITILNAENLSNASAIVGTLSGLADGILASGQSLNEATATIPFEVSMAKEASTLYTEFNAFGDCKNSDKSHYLDLFVLLKDGSIWKYSYDVTQEMHNDQNYGTKTINITLDGLPIPKLEDVGSGGFVPTIDGWESVDIDIQM